MVPQHLLGAMPWHARIAAVSLMDDDFDTDIGEATRALRDRHGRMVTYQRVYLAVVQGDVPAQKRGRVWRMRRGDLPLLAAALGAVTAAA